jgi:enterochelin esterase-like enzyme/outer membrane protein assembly factor BamB
MHATVPSYTFARLLLTLGLLLVLAAPTFAGAAAGAWPHLRGPGLDGRVTTDGVFDQQGLALELAWKTELGPAYSGVSIAGGTAVTFYSDGESDLAVALDADDGRVSWTYRIDSVYRGHDGSSDGPLSSPVIHEGTVYGLGARGQLFALRLDDGRPLWVRRLTDAYGAEEPHFGFTSTPVVEGDVVIVQTGGSEGRAVVGIDRKTGETAWTRGDDKVEYQSPGLVHLAGERQVVAVGNGRVTGLRPADGEILWQHQLAEDDQVGSAHPTPAGDGRFLIFVSGAATVFEVTAAEAGFDVREVYRSKELGGTYALPVYRDGYLYGFRGQFLTCVDAETGEQVWKSRPPGGRGLILVDDKLVIFGAQGHVVVAAASPEGYQETARLQAFDGSAYTWPSFAGGKIFVRNLEEIAAVAVTGGPAGAAALAASEDGSEHAFGRFVRRVEAADDKAALVDEYLAEHPTLPIVDGPFVHFVFRGEAEDVAIEANFVDDGADGLERVAGTDLYHRTYRLEPGTRWEYRFVKDLGERVTDPRNPRTVPPGWGDVGYSELVLEGYELPAHVAEPAATAQGTVETLTFQSERLGNEREIKVYLPAGYGEGARKYPLFVVQELDWADKGRMVAALDNLIGQRVEPLVVAFVAPRDEWWLEGGGTGTEAYVDMLAEELVPFLEEKYRIEKSAEARALMGAGGFGLSAAYAALVHPRVFGKAAACSVHLGAGSGDALMQRIAQAEKSDVDFYVGWFRWDIRRHAGGLDYRGDSIELAEALAENGYSTTGGEIRDAYGWGAVWGMTDDILVSLFPLPGDGTAAAAGSGE